jgi:NADH-quinone oxidoreductase subunit H
MPQWLITFFWAVVKATIAVSFVGLNMLFLVWLERKVSGRIQNRIGPYRVGEPYGFLQLIADGLKMFSKEDVMPARADKWVWWLAPVVIFAPAVMVLMVLPWGAALPGGPVLVMSDLNIGILYIAAITSFTLVAIFMAGWGSNNKYSLFGAMRAAAQLMSYEVPLVLAIIGPVLLAGSLNLTDIVEAQDNYWFVFPQFLAFFVFYIASIAELNRTPFDLSEAESELVAGYATEYSGIRWGIFFMAEYTNLFTASMIGAVLFFGGWKGPFLPPIVWTLIKAYTLVIVAMWIRWTLPRVRIDQLMDLGWKFLIPVSLFNILITGIVLAL